MTLTEKAAAAHTYMINQQTQHRKAVELHEKAIKHHKEAAWLHESGDKRQADSHANIAYNHALTALATGAETLRRI